MSRPAAITVTPRAPSATRRWAQHSPLSRRIPPGRAWSWSGVCSRSITEPDALSPATGSTLAPGTDRLAPGVVSGDVALPGARPAAGDEDGGPHEQGEGAGGPQGEPVDLVARGGVGDRPEGGRHGEDAADGAETDPAEDRPEDHLAEGVPDHECDRAADGRAGQHRHAAAEQRPQRRAK